MFYCKLSPGEQYVFRQGDEAMCFFIVETGSVVVEIDTDAKKTMGKGEGFGEMGLLFGAPRSASIKSETPELFMWGIKRKDFKKVRRDIMIKNYPMNRKSIDIIDFFGKEFTQNIHFLEIWL